MLFWHIYIHGTTDEDRTNLMLDILIGQWAALKKFNFYHLNPFFEEMINLVLRLESHKQTTYLSC